jgi:inosose dehydratase
MATAPALSRRHFLQAGATATMGLMAESALAGPVPGARAVAPKADPFGGFTVGVQSYSYRNFNVEQALTRINELGLRHVELFRGHVPLTATDAQIKAVRAVCTKLNITPVAFGVERFTKDNAANRRIFEFARNLGVRYLSADPDPDSFDSLDRLVADFNIGIAIHPHGPAGKALHRWYSAEAILDAIKGRHRLIGTCLDTGHLIRSAQAPFNRKLDPAAQIRQMGARNFGLHLKDHDNDKRTDVVFGKGALDVVSVLRALREVKFAGYIAIEYEANPNNPTPDIRACLDVFRDAVRKLA